MRMAKRSAPRRGVLITVLVVLGVGAGVAAWWQSDTVLLCRGTVRGEQQTNPNEQMSLVVTINLYRSTMKIDEGSAWPLTGDTSGNVLVAMSPGSGSATINRVTGTVSIRRIVNGLEVFDGTCVRSQQRLF
jgi:hypothetical protein